MQKSKFSFLTLLLISIQILACGAYESGVECFDGFDNDCDGIVDLQESNCELNCTEASSCCKTCDAGKACGDSCISATASCNTYGGCACDRNTNICDSSDYPIIVDDPWQDCCVDGDGEPMMCPEDKN